MTYLNKRYDFYGRKIVSMDGPGTNAGSKNPDQSNCHYPYFQSQCSLTPPDEKCYRAEADTIARMHPAMAFFTGDGAMVYRLAQDHIVTATGNLAPDSYYQQLEPYMYGLTNGSRPSPSVRGVLVQEAGRQAGAVRRRTRRATSRTRTATRRHRRRSASSASPTTSTRPTTPLRRTPKNC